MGDFKVKLTDTVLPNFYETYNLKSIVKRKTYFKNLNKPSFIDLIVTNKPKSFQNSMVIETVIFTKCVIAVMKVYYSKQKATMIQHRKLKDFNNEAFLKDLKAPFAKPFHEEIVPFETLRKSPNVTLEKQASKKNKI